ncbi:MAG: hypothetical protein RQ758_05355 [Methanomicrobiaceae archaeon]|nr:hypothetical protein [Methanomicrobiaceae archaeon]
MDEAVKLLEYSIESHCYDAKAVRNKLREMKYVPLVEGVSSDIWTSEKRDLLVFLEWSNQSLCRKYRISEAKTVSEAELKFVKTSPPETGGMESPSETERGGQIMSALEGLSVPEEGVEGKAEISESFSRFLERLKQ